MKPNILAILALLGLHGCNTVEDPFLDGMTGNMPVATGNRELPVHLAWASLTGLGEMPIGLRQTSTDGVTRQTLVWANTTTLPGENALTISTAAASRYMLRKGPGRAEITRTLRSEFPGVAMTIDPVIRQNAYGAYGAATGKLDDKGGCVYAWQIIKRDVDLGRNQPAEVSLRYCHSSLGPEVLADLLTGLSLRGPTTIAPAAAVAYGYPSPATTKGVVIQTAPVDRETAEVSPAAPAFVAGDREEDFKDRTNVRIPMP
ncbi:MAG: cellulose biosynthesis protein BcsN [Allorhizobium sp.]|uniref:cellulose biosynthesis protein BcsN n=1 Tax=Allorhizobium sp. TaxID=633478 RepID=UPI004034738A